MPVSTWSAAGSRAPGAAERGPFLDLLPGSEDGPQVVFGVGGAGAGQEAVEHVDRGIRAPRRGRGASRGCATKKVRQPARAAAGTALDADAVGVGLDDGRAFRAARARAGCASSRRARRDRW